MRNGNEELAIVEQACDAGCVGALMGYLHMQISHCVPQISAILPLENDVGLLCDAR